MTQGTIYDVSQAGSARSYDVSSANASDVSLAVNSSGRGSQDRSGVGIKTGPPDGYEFPATVASLPCITAFVESGRDHDAHQEQQCDVNACSAKLRCVCGG